MAVRDDDEQPVAQPVTNGEDLSTLSEAELGERIVHLHSEIERVRSALNAKRASRETAASFFKN